MHLMWASALTALWGWGLTYWTPAFLMRSYGLSAGEAGGITGPIHLVAGIAATVFTGWFLGRRYMHDARRVVWFMGGAIGLATVPSIVIFWTHSLELAKVMLWIFVPSIYFYIGPCFGLLNNLAPPRMRAQFCALTLLVANIGNLVVAPQLPDLLLPVKVRRGLLGFLRNHPTVSIGGALLLLLVLIGIFAPYLGTVDPTAIAPAAPPPAARPRSGCANHTRMISARKAIAET